MRKTVLSIAVVVMAFTQMAMAQKSNIEIAAGETLEFDYPNYKLYELQLKNNTGKGIGVEVQDKETGEFRRGFGLGPYGKVEVMIEKESKIVFANTSAKMGKLTLTVLNDNAKWATKTENTTISFTLVNKGAKSIPLIIPNVMNPNLSPFSSSGVDLKVGQELLFRQGGKRYVLLTVDETIKEGDKLDVGALLRTRKKELGL